MRQAIGRWMVGKWRWRMAGLLAVIAVSAGSCAWGQAQAGAKAEVKPVTRSQADERLIENQKKQLEDWPNLKRFHEEDAALGTPASGEDRVVFMGDSITQNWLRNGAPDGEPDPGFFPGRHYINRGISGQTTPQMLVRFRQDVIDLKPRAVVIFAGTNDVAGNTGEMTAEDTESNLASMADLAQANGIRVVLCSILPASEFPWRPGRNPGPKIVAINDWMKKYADEKGYVFVDFHSAMADAKLGLPANLSKDGVHPVKAGYDIMNPLVVAGIEKALGGK